MNYYDKATLQRFYMSISLCKSPLVQFPSVLNLKISDSVIRKLMYKDVDYKIEREIRKALFRYNFGHLCLKLENEGKLKYYNPKVSLLDSSELYSAFNFWIGDLLLSIYKVLTFDYNTKRFSKILLEFRSHMKTEIGFELDLSWIKDYLDQSTLLNEEFLFSKRGPYKNIENQTDDISELSTLKSQICLLLIGRKSELLKSLFSFPYSTWDNVVEENKIYHKVSLASTIFDNLDMKSTEIQQRLEPVLVESLGVVYIKSEVGQEFSSTQMEVVDYAVIDMPPGRVVKEVCPGLQIGRPQQGQAVWTVIKKAQVVVSR
jgi:hypothetical protein